MQIDGPKGKIAYVWLPYPADNQPIPEFALIYPAGQGRHSNTYASPGLSRGLPALKLVIHNETEVEGIVEYIRALRDSKPLPEIKAHQTETFTQPIPVDISDMPPPAAPKPRREAIPRSVVQDVFQRYGQRCAECASREKLCIDHIIPLSRGGSNTARNLQLLCERCNLSKGNRI